jgi:hypothetical protein
MGEEMTLRRTIVRVSELPAYLAHGYVEIFRVPGGLRLDEPAAIVEWSGNGAAPEVA